LYKVLLLDIVKRVISEFELFNGDFHLIRFLDVVANYTNIEALLFEYERIDASAAASDLSGVRVLTIHKSKGLEYDHVIVMDRLKKAPPSRDSIIYEYDGIHLSNVFLRMKGREALDKEYENAILKEKILEKEDSLNALYVAFTRAKENLFIVAKPKDSMFDILDVTVSKRGTLVCRKTQHMQQVSLKSLEYKELYYGTQSDLLEVQKEKEEDLQAINFGLGLHYMLEMLSGFELQNLEDAKNALLNKYGYILEDAEIEDITQRVTSLLYDTAFRELIQGECYREKAIKYKNNLRYIDLLVKCETPNADKHSLFAQEIWNVIDYKSSLSYAKEHEKQVKYYINAIEEITGDEVRGYICYLLQDKIKIVKI
jgi:exodeoxyribonuclease V beta subunit